MGVDASVPATHCPRCGYDQSGAVATWRESCSVRGTCPECGLEFFWGDLLNPKLDEVTRYFEYAHSRLIRAIFHTVIAAHFPRTFWSVFRLHHPPRIGRLLVLASGGLLLSWLFVGLAAGVLYVVYEGLLLHAIEGDFFADGSWDRWNNPSKVAVVVARVAHGLLPGCDVTAGGGVLGIKRVRMESYWVPWAFIMAVLMPLLFILVPASRRVWKVRLAHICRVWAAGLVTMPAVLFAWSALRAIGQFFGAVHVVRNGKNWDPIGSWWFWIQVELSAWRDEALVAVAIFWIWHFWGTACGRYLRIPAPRVTAALATLLAGLLAWLLLDLIPGAGASMASSITNQ